MPLVDEVWGRMEFRTPWSRAREREAVAAALARFLAWHHRPGARTVVATERGLRAEVTLPDGQVVRLHGYADRLELDEDGRVVVVDLKTGKYQPDRPEVERHPQLGLYQLAVDHGAADDAGRARSTLGWRRAGPARALGDDAAEGAAPARARRGHAPIEEQLMQAAATAPQRGVRRPARQPLRPLRVPGDLPRQGLRDGALVTRADASTPPSSSRDLLGVDWLFSAQQWAAITAPLEPAVVIAGAGSGKTTRDGRARRLAGRHRPGRARRGPRPHVHHQGDGRARSADPRQPAPGRAAARRGRAAGRRPTARTTTRSRSRRSRPTTPTPPALLVRARPADRPRARHPADRRRQRATSSPPARCSATPRRSSSSPTRRATSSTTSSRSTPR